MDHQSVLAAVGRKQLQFEAQDEAYTKLLAIFAEVIDGTIDRSRVMLNVTDRTWMVVPQGEKPALPATLNGLPKCVVAP